jgi:hypothetical protein
MESCPQIREITAIGSFHRLSRKQSEHEPQTLFGTQAVNQLRRHPLPLFSGSDRALTPFLGRCALNR